MPTASRSAACTRCLGLGTAKRLCAGFWRSRSGPPRAAVCIHCQRACSTAGLSRVTACVLAGHICTSPPVRHVRSIVSQSTTVHVYRARDERCVQRLPGSSAYFAWVCLTETSCDSSELSVLCSGKHTCRAVSGCDRHELDVICTTLNVTCNLYLGSSVASVLQHCVLWLHAC